MSEKRMSRRYRLHTYETDTHGNMSIVALFNYLQDIASSHASSLHFGKEDLEKNDMFWVLSRIYAEMDYMPGWDSEIIITTWPRAIEGIFALRDYEIADSSGKRVGGATSAWLMLDSKTRRPKRPDQLLSLLNQDVPAESSLGRNPNKISAIESEEYRCPSFKVKYSDLDVNMHVNNVKYIQWALDAYPLDFRIKNIMSSVEVNYISESFPGDEVSVGISQNGEDKFLHSVRRDNDGKELCRIEVKWKSEK
jgi:acyl-ACP thioesterase